MASLDDIINITDEQAEIIFETDDGTNKSGLGNRILFTFNEDVPINDQVAYNEKIYYLDNSKTYIPAKPLGKYILKNHQLNLQVNCLSMSIIELKCLSQKLKTPKSYQMNHLLSC